MPDNKIDFKAKLDRLDEIVETMKNEKTDLSLSVKLYEEGKQIVKELEETLAEAEKKIEKVIED